MDRHEELEDQVEQLATFVRDLSTQMVFLANAMRAGGLIQGPGDMPSRGGGEQQPKTGRAMPYDAEGWRQQMREQANPITTAVIESSYPDAGRLGGTAVGILCARPGADIRWARRRGLDPARRSIVISVIDADQGTHMPVVLDVEDAKQIVNRLSEAIGTAEDETAHRNWPWQ